MNRYHPTIFFPIFGMSITIVNAMSECIEVPRGERSGMSERSDEIPPGEPVRTNSAQIRTSYFSIVYIFASVIEYTMRKIISVLFLLTCLAVLPACSGKKEIEPVPAVSFRRLLTTNVASYAIICRFVWLFDINLVFLSQNLRR